MRDKKCMLNIQYLYYSTVERWKGMLIQTARLQGLIFVVITTPLPVHASIGRGVVLTTN